jgi:hypothetical protein
MGCLPFGRNRMVMFPTLLDGRLQGHRNSLREVQSSKIKGHRKLLLISPNLCFDLFSNY